MIIGIILVLFGGLVTFANWRLVYEWYRHKRSSSMIPLMGGLSLALGIYCLLPTAYASLAIFADPGTYSLLCAIPLLTRNAWQTSSFRIAHKLTAKSDNTHYTLKLFKGGIFVMKYDFNPPQVCNEHGALIVEGGIQGKWKQENNSIFLNDYCEKRKTILTKTGDCIYLSKESNYPEDKQYKYDSLNNIKFQAAAGGEMLQSPEGTKVN